MSVDPAFSRKITSLSILAMVGVVSIHSTAYLTMDHPAPWNVFVEMLATQSFSSWAVPFFFLVSGFWFGRGKYIQGRQGFGALIRQKGHTLFVPYLCWCLLGLLVVLPLILANNYLGHKGIWERTLVSIPGLWPKIDALFGITTVNPQNNAPLWYVRSLLIMFVFAPVWRGMIRLPFGKTILVLAAVINLVVYPLVPVIVAIPPFAVSWFAFGLVFSAYPVEKWRVPTGLWIAALVAYVMVCVSYSLRFSGLIPAFGGFVQKGCLSCALIPFVGVVFFWGFYDRVPTLAQIPIPWCVSQTFFIYCFHEHICGYLLATSKYVFGKTDLVTCVCAVVVPWLAFAISALMAIAFYRTSAVAYSILTGCRTGRNC